MRDVETRADGASALRLLQKSSKQQRVVTFSSGNKVWASVAKGRKKTCQFGVHLADIVSSSLRVATQPSNSPIISMRRPPPSRNLFLSLSLSSVPSDAWFF